MSRVPGWLGRLGAGLTELSKRLDERRADVDQESRESQGEQKDDTAPEESGAYEPSSPAGADQHAPCSCPQPGTTRGFSGSPLQESANARASTVTTQKLPTLELGDDRWSHLLVFTTGGSSSVIKQTAVRIGTAVVVVSGSAALVDAHMAKAVDKADSAR